jgi:hypothetical protein
MSKILIAGAGGAPSEGVIKSLIRVGHEVVGMGSDPEDLCLSNASKKYHVPRADDANYENKLLNILNKEKPDLVHFQNDLEIYHASLLSDKIRFTGCKTFMPRHEVIDNCVHKYKSWKKIKAANIRVPNNIFINNTNDLKNAFESLSDKNGNIWLRSALIGAGGKGSLPTNNYDFAKHWINFHNGWGSFIAAELLTKNSVTWLSIWYEGELIVAQGRLRCGWTHGNRSASGVTGVTKVGKTYSNELVNDIAISSIKSIDQKPHGIYGVDMTYDNQGIPNPTEINISRFFTTILFFTEAGLNLPAIFVELGILGETKFKKGTISPLEDGLIWLRGMDVAPMLCSEKKLKESIIWNI